MAKAQPKPDPPARKDPQDALFDRALDNTGMPAREEGETIEAYVGRPAWGPYTRQNLQTAWECAERLDQVGATSAAYSARCHHDNPAPPDAHPLKP